MIVRAANHRTDARAILDGARDFISRLDYTAHLPEDPMDLAKALDILSSLPGYECWIVEDEGRVVGVIGLLFTPSLWNPKALAMTELFIWAAKDAPATVFLRLLRTASRRADERGATIREYVRLTSSPPGIERVYAAMGLRKVQESWVGVG